MALRTVVTFPDPILKQRCAEVTDFGAELHTLLDDMADTMAKEEGIGLAANQVAVSLRVFIMDVPVGQERPDGSQDSIRLEVINPRIVGKRGEVHYDEGCLSFPGVTESVLRAAEIELAFQDRHGVAQQVTATGLVAICMQHELDHLDGITFIDRLSPLKRRVVLRDYLRDNAERIAEQDRKAKLQQRRARA